MLKAKKIRLNVSEQDAATLEMMQGKCRGLYGVPTFFPFKIPAKLGQVPARIAHGPAGKAHFAQFSTEIPQQRASSAPK